MLPVKLSKTYYRNARAGAEPSLGHWVMFTFIFSTDFSQNSSPFFHPEEEDVFGVDPTIVTGLVMIQFDQYVECTLGTMGSPPHWMIDEYLLFTTHDFFF